MMKVLERLGLRALHLFACRITGEKSLPTLAEAPNYAKYSAHEINELRMDARYFGSANFWRLLMHVPIMLMFAKFNAVLPASFFLILIVFHASLLVMESYKATVIQLLHPVEKVEKELPMVRCETWGDWLFAPKKWETDGLYKVLGVYGFRDLVEWVITHMKLTKKERKEGKTIEFVGGSSLRDVVEFENGSRVNECVHLTMATIDLVPIAFAIYHQLWLALPFTLWVFWGDFWCALLQRLNRRRIWTLIKRARKLEARSS